MIRDTHFLAFWRDLNFGLRIRACEGATAAQAARAWASGLTPGEAACVLAHTPEVL